MLEGETGSGMVGEKLDGIGFPRMAFGQVAGQFSQAVDAPAVAPAPVIFRNISRKESTEIFALMKQSVFRIEKKSDHFCSLLIGFFDVFLLLQGQAGKKKEGRHRESGV